LATGSVSIVLPCLDEAATVGDCVREALRGLRALGRDGEVVVVDNGSTDGSARIAAEAGARVVHEPRRGYGSALGRGMREAAGDIVVLGDADGSYRFDDLGPLVRAVEAGADLAMGSRTRGRIEPGAMPFLNRRLGTPVLTALVNLLFRARISDVNCGQRALRGEVARTLDLNAAGMEFASEMVIKAALRGLAIADVPVDFRKDRRPRPPHLRRWRDGWRHLRFILLFAPNTTLVCPGLALLAVGGYLAAPALFGRREAHGPSAFVGAGLVLLGAQLVQVGLVVKTWYHTEGFYRRPYLDRICRFLRLEVGLALGLGLFAVGLVTAAPIVRAWRADTTPDRALGAASLVYLVLGMQVLCTSVILSVLGIRRRGAGAEARRPAAESREAPAYADDAPVAAR